MTWLMKKLAGNSMPKGAIITSCDIRSNLLIKVLLGLVGLVVVGLVVFIFGYGFSTLATFHQQTDVWFIPKILAFAVGGGIVPWLIKDSRAMNSFLTFLMDGIKVKGRNISGTMIVGVAVTLLLNICLLDILKLTSEYRSPNVLEFIIGMCGLVGAILDIIIVIGIVLVVVSYAYLVVYRATIGKKTKITYLSTNGEEKIAYYPWYKAKAIEWSLCKIYEPG